MFRYLGVFEPAEDLPGVLVVTVPDVPGAVTQGNDLADAKSMAVDALELILSDYVEKGEDLPSAVTTKAKNGHWIIPSTLAQLKLALYVEFRKARITKVELGARMGIVKQQVDRLFELQHSSRVDQIELAFHALGKRISISIQPENEPKLIGQVTVLRAHGVGRFSD